MDNQEESKQLITYDQVLVYVSPNQAEDDAQNLFKFQEISVHQ